LKRKQTGRKEELMQYVIGKEDALFVEAKNPDRVIRLWVDRERGAKNISCGSCEIPVNSQIPYHSHEKEEEIMFIYRGKGILEVEGGETFPLEPETVVYVPPGIKHVFKNTGSEPLCFVFFYAPPGPEQIIRKMANSK